MIPDVPIISADSHITEPPDTYTARIDARFRDRAPHLVHDAKRGDLFVIDGLDKPIPMGLAAPPAKPARGRGRQARAGPRDVRGPLRGPAPRRLGPRGAARRPGARWRQRGGAVPDR